jgi:peptide/nickel transport system substrate-binding protein
MKVAGVLMACVLAAGMAGSASARYGGTIFVGLTQYPDSMDPTVSQGTGVTIYRDMCYRLYGTLFNHGVVENVPQLAASMPVPSKDGLSYTVQLKQGVLFNDGTPLNAQAVVTSYQRFITVPNSSRKSDFSSVANVTADGPYTVVFHMNQRDSSFTSNMFVFSPTALANEGANFAANPVCAGPFMFDHQDQGIDVTIVKSPYYWNKSAVHLDKIVFEVFPDPAAAAAALEAGDIQELHSLAPAELPQIQKDPNLRVLRFPSQGFESIVINLGNKAGCCTIGHPAFVNVGTPLASSPLLRQAFEEAIDRAALVRVVEQGLAVPTCTPIEPSNQPWYGLTKVPCTPFDPKDAKRLVAKSGIQNPTVKLSISGPADATLAQFIQAEEAAVGINVVIDASNPSLSAGTFDAAINSFSGGPDPNGNTYAFFNDTIGTRNYGGYSSARMDYVLANALKARQPKARAVSYRVVNQLVETDRPRIFLYAPIQLDVISTSVAGVFLNGGGQPLFETAQLK